MSDDEKHETTAEVLSLFDAAVPVRAKPLTPQQKACTHLAISVDHHARMVTCRSCSRVLDPFEWILNLSKHWSDYARRADVARHAVSLLEGQKRALAAEEQELRSKVGALRRRKLPPEPNVTTTDNKREKKQ